MHNDINIDIDSDIDIIYDIGSDIIAGGGSCSYKDYVATRIMWLLGSCGCRDDEAIRIYS